MDLLTILLFYLFKRLQLIDSVEDRYLNHLSFQKISWSFTLWFSVFILSTLLRKKEGGELFFNFEDIMSVNLKVIKRKTLVYFIPFRNVKRRTKNYFTILFSFIQLINYFNYVKYSHTSLTFGTLGYIRLYLSLHFYRALKRKKKDFSSRSKNLSLCLRSKQVSNSSKRK